MSSQKVGFYFYTNSNNRYFYNDIDGTVSIEKENNNLDYIYDTCEKAIPFYGNKQILHYFLKENGFNQMMLIVTEVCNIRCKYCVFSGNYENQRKHGTKHMSFEVAKKAIDRFFETQKEKMKNNALHKPLLGFYGGEPLMNFQLVKKATIYAKEVFKGNISFLLTSNGTIMNEEIAEFLIDNKFLLSFSINGEKEEHDRLRVYENERGTYDIVIKNLVFLREKNKDYYSKYITAIGCYDWKTNFESINRFCNNEAIGFPKISRLSMISDFFTDWYKKFTKEDKENFILKKRKMEDIFFEQIINEEKISPVLKLMFSGVIYEVLNRIENIPSKSMRPPFMPYSGSCIPGSKIAVSPNGEIHCCEKVNNTRAFGNVENGLNEVAIIEMLEDYYNTMAPICFKCPIKRLCPICFTACLDQNGQFTRSQIGDCKQVLESMRHKFSFVYNILETGLLPEELLEKIKV